MEIKSDTCPHCKAIFEYTIAYGNVTVVNDSGCEHVRYDGPNYGFANPAAVALGSIITPKKSSAARENGKLGGRPKAEVKCGVEYSIGKTAPSTARYGLYYHGYVQYYRSLNAAEKAQKRLDDYSLRASSITELN